MGEYRSIEQRIEETSRRWPFIVLKRKTRDEASGPCPWCGGEDRFRVWTNGYYECRVAPGHCGRSGWLDEENRAPLTQPEILEMRIAAIERQQQEHEKRLSALERIAKCTDYLAYHRNMNDEAWLYWNQQGMLLETITRYQLGYCQRCPTDYEGRPSYTIPVINGGKLRNIRHRLIGASNGDKYRPHLAGLPPTLFNADYITQPQGPEILIVEGEKKSIIAAQLGFPNVGIMGKSGFKPEWSQYFAQFARVNIALDPDAIDEAVTIARLFERRGRVVSLPDKLDDLVICGATALDIQAMIDLGRPV